MDIGKRLKELRKSRNVTITALANEIGLTREYLSNVERNINTPSLQTLQKICDALGITLAEFFSNNEPDLPPEYRELITNVKQLTSEEMRVLNEFLKTFKRS